MGINILKIVLLITATQLLMASGCNKNGTKPCAMVTPYSFNVTSVFSPQREVYNVGDTIFLNSTFPKTLTNLISNQQVDYNNSVGIGGNFKTVYMDTINKTIQESLNRFSLNVIKGSKSIIGNSPNSGINIFYLEESSN